MAQFNYVKTRALGDRLVKKFGMRAVLRRAVDIVPDRICWVVLPEYLSRENTQLANPTDRKVYIAAGLGDVLDRPPDNEADQLVTFVQPGGVIEDEILSFSGASVTPIRPAGITVLWEATVRR